MDYSVDMGGYYKRNMEVIVLLRRRTTEILAPRSDNPSDAKRGVTQATFRPAATHRQMTYHPV